MKIPADIVYCIYNFCNDFRYIVESLDIFPYLEDLAYKKYKIQELNEEEINLYSRLSGDEIYTLSLYSLIHQDEDFKVIKFIANRRRPPRYFYSRLLKISTNLDTTVFLSNYFIRYINMNHFSEYNSKFAQLYVIRKINKILVKKLSKYFYFETPLLF